MTDNLLQTLADNSHTLPHQSKKSDINQEKRKDDLKKNILNGGVKLGVNSTDCASITLYFLIRDMKKNDDGTLKYPRGRVLLLNTDPKSTRNSHARLLQWNKLVKERTIHDDQERRRLLEQGFKILKSDDIIEEGVIGFKSDGSRHICMRINHRKNENCSKENIDSFSLPELEQISIDLNYQRHKDIKLIYAVIKKQQEKQLYSIIENMDVNKQSDETSFVAFAPEGKTIQEPEIFFVPSKQTLGDFIQSNHLTPWRITTVGHIKRATPPLGNGEVSLSYSFSPASYEHMKVLNEQLAVTRMKQTKPLNASFQWALMNQKGKGV